jgi:CBS domain containing-hemolysin-like protein
LVLEQLGRIPVGGDEVQLRGYESDGIPQASSWRATVIRMDGRRIDLLELAQTADRLDSTAVRGR